MWYTLTENKKASEAGSELRRQTEKRVNDSPRVSVTRGVEGKRMEIMGFRNMSHVDELARAGRFNIKYGNGRSFDSMQALVLSKLALVTADWPLDEAAKAKRLLPRTYRYGWLALAQEFGMTLPDSPDEIEVIGDEPRAPKKERKAVNRISETVKKLEAAGLIKCLRAGSPQKRNNAVWLLLLGDEEENAEVEAYVRRRLNLPTGR